jgi:hypothetical protein
VASPLVDFPFGGGVASGAAWPLVDFLHLLNVYLFSAHNLLDGNVS